MRRGGVARRFAVLVLLLAWSSGCGYALTGRSSSLPASVRVIGVPLFVNQSPYAGVEVAITEAVRAELASRGALRVLPQEEAADAVLSGTVIEVRTEPTAFSETREATRYAVIVDAGVEFRETGQDGEVLWSNPRQQFREEYDVTGELALGDLSTLFGQDANALDRLARSVARAIVTAILEAF